MTRHEERVRKLEDLLVAYREAFYRYHQRSSQRHHLEYRAAQSDVLTEGRAILQARDASNPEGK